MNTSLMVTRTFVVGYDGSPEATHALDEVLSWLNPEGTKIIIVSIAQLYSKKNFLNILRVDFDIQLLDDANEEIEQRTREFVNALRDKIAEKHSQLNVLSITRTGDPREELVKVALEFNADAVVVGQRGLGPLERTILGSVSNHLVNNCPCSVIVVRHQHKENE